MTTIMLTDVIKSAEWIESFNRQLYDDAMSDGDHKLSLRIQNSAGNEISGLQSLMTNFHSNNAGKCRDQLMAIWMKIRGWPY